MLSYQHIYHAGNAADVHKHALLAWMLRYLTRKDKPVSYLETHAGRGLYRLDAAEAVKTGEAASGVKALHAKLPKDHPYAQALARIQATHGDEAYPGSPMLASTLLRKGDRLHLAELHPQEYNALSEVMTHKAKCYQLDGFEMAHAVAPPAPRRGMLVIDPSYEVKSEYDTIPEQIAKLHRKWNVGVIALWYPLLTSGLHHPMLDRLQSLDLPQTLRNEVRFPPARDGHHMVGSGMFVVNAPYGSDAAGAQISDLFA